MTPRTAPSSRSTSGQSRFSPPQVCCVGHIGLYCFGCSVLIDSSVKEDEALDSDEGVRVRPGRSRKEALHRETELLSAMLKAHPIGREALLTHPVTEAFLYLKWLYVRKWFWFIRFFYVSLRHFDSRKLGRRRDIPGHRIPARKRTKVSWRKLYPRPYYTGGHRIPEYSMQTDIVSPAILYRRTSFSGDRT